MSNPSDNPKKYSARSAFFIVIVILVALGAGISGSLLSSFYIFPAVTKIPYFEKFLETDGNGQTLFKLIEREKEIVSEESVFTDVVNATKKSIVSVVVASPNNIAGAEVVGTGVIATADGLIVTNKHLVREANIDVQVITDEYQVYEATVAALDPLNDLALLKIKADNLPAANLYPAEEIKLGQRILALGNKYRQRENFVSSGVLSLVDKGVLNSEHISLSMMEGLLQTDALVKSFNTGGPLVNLNGEVIGLLAAADDLETVGFAIPVSVVRSAIDSFIKHERIQRSTLGVNFETLTPDLAQVEKNDRREGARLVAGDNVPAVTPGSAAAQAGLRAGDIIHKINSRNIDMDNGFMRLLQEYPPETEIEITYIRNDEEKTVQVKVGEIR
jgi:serine protease Do